MERDVFKVTWNTYKCCTNGTVSISECERVSDIMMVVVN
jgi:hypothetical protein